MQVLPGFRPAFDFIRPQLPLLMAPWEMLFLRNGVFLLPFPARALGDRLPVGPDSMSVLSSYTVLKTLLFSLVSSSPGSQEATLLSLQPQLPGLSLLSLGRTPVFWGADMAVSGVWLPRPHPHYDAALTSWPEPLTHPFVLESTRTIR